MNAKGLILCSLLLAPALCRAQEGREPAEEVTPGEVVRVETDLVPVEVTVRDAAGQVVRGLARGDARRRRPAGAVNRPEQPC